MREDVSLKSSLPERSSSNIAHRALNALLNVAMPPVCLGCQGRLADHHALCATCWSEIEFIRPPLCDRLGVPLPYGVGDTMISAAAAARPPKYDRARAAAVYSGTVKALIHDFKFRDRLELRRLFVRWLQSAGAPFWEQADLLVPVPLHFGRLLTRRYNQSATLGQALGLTVGLPFEPLALKRIRATARQVGLTVQQREQNVRGAFAVPRRYTNRLHEANVVLIDDVITTGATVSSCATALRRAGAARVDVLALAVTVPGRETDAASGFLVKE